MQRLFPSVRFERYADDAIVHCWSEEQVRRAKNRRGTFFVNFLPAISAKAAKAIRHTIREWRMASTRNNHRLEDLARLVNPVVRGWVNDYGRYYRSECVRVLGHLNEALAAFVCPVATGRETRRWRVGAG